MRVIGWLLALLYAATAALLYRAVRNAPEGYEDERGFHYGRGGE